MSRKALGMENLSPYSGFMRGTWREGSYTDDSERLETEDPGAGSLLLSRVVTGLLNGCNILRRQMYVMGPIARALCRT